MVPYLGYTGRTVAGQRLGGHPYRVADAESTESLGSDVVDEIRALGTGHLSSVSVLKEFSVAQKSKGHDI